jgi:hypothetical protein
MRGHLSQHLDVAEQKLKAAQDAISELRKAIENLDIANDESVDEGKQLQLSRLKQIIPMVLQKNKNKKYSQVKNQDGFVFGDRVTVSWDRQVHVFSRRKGSAMEKEGRTGFIIGHTKDYVYVLLEPIEELEVMRKKNHNVTRDKGGVLTSAI